jgi:glutamate synthase (NADPH/NADH) small chain
MAGRVPAPVVPASERIKNFSEVVSAYNLQQAVAEASRCLACHDAPCQKGCPAGVDIPAFIGRIKTKDLRGAIDAIREGIVFPGVCGRVCPVEELCEKNCVMKEMTEAVAIGELQRFAADYEMKKKLKPEPVAPAKKPVAIVGAGPAGLAAAAELIKMGYGVEVFEGRPTPGGLLSYGIPTYRLPKEVTAAEIEYIKGLGVKVRTNEPVESVSKLLEQGFSAVFIGVGTMKSVPLGVEGEDLEGVYSGLDFLERIGKGEPPSLSGKRVGVVGGGDVAIDASRSALRLGASTVTVIYRRSFKEMPAHVPQIQAAREEGVQFIILATPTKILGKGGKVTGIECIRMRLAEPDETGRRRPVPIPGTEFKLDLDVVIEAIGQKVDEEFIKKNPDIKVVKGLIAVDERGMTSKPGVFAGGDVVNGGVTVVQAIAEGKRAAEGIDKFLGGR